MSLKDWLNSGWIIDHQTSPKEIADFISLAERDLKNSDVPGLDPEWQLNMAYNAALHLAAAALAAAGYRTSHESHHFRTIISLAQTIGADRELVDKFDAFRKKRNISQYDRAGQVSEKEVKEMKKLALEVKGKVTAWLKTNYPELLPDK